MTKPHKDPLLAVARFVLIFFIGVLSLAVTALIVLVPVLLFKQADLLAALVADGKNATTSLIPAGCFVLVGAAGLIALAIYFLVLLRRIVNSVGEGDPFIPENAQRLARMGWIALWGQLASLPVAVAITWIASIAADAGDNVRANLGFSGGGIILVLILFILARVFRHGTHLREELEGTV